MGARSACSQREKQKVQRSWLRQNSVFESSEAGSKQSADLKHTAAIRKHDELAAKPNLRKRKDSRKTQAKQHKTSSIINSQARHERARTAKTVQSRIASCDMTLLRSDVSYRKGSFAPIGAVK